MTWNHNRPTMPTIRSLSSLTNQRHFPNKALKLQRSRLHLICNRPLPLPQSRFDFARDLSLGIAITLLCRPNTPVRSTNLISRRCRRLRRNRLSGTHRITSANLPTTLRNLIRLIQLSTLLTSARKDTSRPHNHGVTLINWVQTHINDLPQHRNVGAHEHASHPKPSAQEARPSQHATQTTKEPHDAANR